MTRQIRQLFIERAQRAIRKPPISVIVILESRPVTDAFYYCIAGISSIFGA